MSVAPVFMGGLAEYRRGFADGSEGAPRRPPEDPHHTGLVNWYTIGYEDGRFVYPLGSEKSTEKTTERSTEEEKEATE